MTLGCRLCQVKTWGMVNYSKPVTLLCEAQEERLQQYLATLATIAGANLTVTTVNPGEASSLPGDGFGVAGVEFTASGTDSAAAGALVFLSQTVARSRPGMRDGAYVLSLQGEGVGGAGQGPSLVLPQDEREILNLMMPRTQNAFIVAVRALVPGAQTAVVAGLLAQGISCGLEGATAGPRPDVSPRVPSGRALFPGPSPEPFSRGSVPDSAGSDTNTVCWVDGSGSNLPLNTWVAPVTGSDLQWSDLCEARFIPGYRVAAALPRWGKVALLGDAAGLQVKAGSALTNLRSLSSFFSCLVIDLGSGGGSLLRPPSAAVSASAGSPGEGFKIGATVWVADNSRAALLAWESLAEQYPQSEHLVLHPGGALPLRQARKALQESRPDVTVHDWSMPARFWKTFSRDGLTLPLPRQANRATRSLTTGLLRAKAGDYR